MSSFSLQEISCQASSSSSKVVEPSGNRWATLCEVVTNGAYSRRTDQPDTESVVEPSCNRLATLSEVVTVTSESAMDDDEWFTSSIENPDSISFASFSATGEALDADACIAEPLLHMAPEGESSCLPATQSAFRQCVCMCVCARAAHVSFFTFWVWESRGLSKCLVRALCFSLGLPRQESQKLH